MSEKSEKNKSPFAEFVDFRMFSGEIVSVKDAEGRANLDRPQVRGIGSSELEDLAGDRMLRGAMDDMSAFSIRSAIFMNHEYRVPEDIFGALQRAPEVKEYKPGGPGLLNSQSPWYGVEIIADVAKSNERAIKSFNIINDDKVRLGFSIGCQITGYEIRKSEDGSPIGLDITHLMPYEWSLVGIPCNQQSWVTNAVKGLMQKNANAPLPTSEEDVLYVKKHYRDFDSLTALHIHRNFTKENAEYLIAQQNVYKNYGLRVTIDAIKDGK